MIIRPRPFPSTGHRLSGLAALTVAALVAIALPAAAITPAPDHLPQTPVVDTTPQVVDLTFPVADPESAVSYPDTFLALRGGGTRLHAATDIMAPKHRPVHAAVGGTISWAPHPEPSYGWMISIRGDDGHRYAYVHLNNDTPTKDADGGWLDDDNGGVEHAYAPRIVEAIRTTGSAQGLRIERGELIGWNGDSGNAKGIASHLHFEIHVTADDGSSYRINPYHSLVAAVERGDVPGAGVELVEEPDAPTHEGIWQDVDPTSSHGPAVERLTTAGILAGCDDSYYCPTEAVTRGDLASYLAAALQLDVDPNVRSRFTDVEAEDPRQGAIDAIDRAGVLQGYGDDLFGPDTPLTRAQLASVLVRGFEVPAATLSAGFDDVRVGGTHQPAIDAVAEAGLTLGCDASRYCGSAHVQRGQIASFIDRGLAYLHG